MCNLEAAKKKELREWVLGKSKGNPQYKVELKNEKSLTQEVKTALFGMCDKCPLCKGERLEVRIGRPHDPSMKPRVKCDAMDGLWVKPVQQDASPDECERRHHVANKKMARPHGYAEHANVRVTAQAN